MKEKTLGSKCVFKGSFLDVRKDKVIFSNGSSSTREWINHPGASVIIPILPDGRVCLIRQYRYAAKADFIELPAGKIDDKESAEQCANRELEEEIGYKANKISFIEALILLILSNNISLKFITIEGSYPKFLKLKISNGFSANLM